MIFVLILIKLEQINIQNINDLMSFEHIKLNSILGLFSKINQVHYDNTTIKTFRYKNNIKPAIQKLRLQIQEQELETNLLSRLDYLEEMLYTEVKSNPNSAFEISMDLHNIGNCGYITALIFDRDEDPLTNMCQ